MKLDEWVNEVRHQIQRNWYRFLANPAHYENSPGYFRILVLITTLQRDLGVRYNPERVKDQKFQDPYCVNPDFRDSRDLFIHGILNGTGGTCSSLPVLYTAICRRLGFPVHLVEAKDHLYCRWDDIHGESSPRERFNIEGTGLGFGMYPDSFYETWPRELTDFDRQNGVYGRCLSAREELACFLTTRGHCLLDNGRRDEAIECFRWSVDLAPHDKRYLLQLNNILNPNPVGYYIPLRNLYPVDAIVKVPCGRLPPSDLPWSVPIKYVAAGKGCAPPRRQPISRLPVKVATGGPLPPCLPSGTPIQVVSPNQADNFSAFAATVQWQNLPSEGKLRQTQSGATQRTLGIGKPQRNSPPSWPGY